MITTEIVMPMGKRDRLNYLPSKFNLKVCHASNRAGNNIDSGSSANYFHAITQIVAPLLQALQSVPCSHNIALLDDQALLTADHLLPSLLAVFNTCWKISIVNSTIYSNIFAEQLFLSDTLVWNQSMALAARSAFRHFFAAPVYIKPEKQLSKAVVAIRSMRDRRRSIENVNELNDIRTSLVEVRTARMAKLTLAEQVSLMSRTDILFGQHGADLTNMLFLPTRAAVVQVSDNIVSIRRCCAKEDVHCQLVFFSKGFRALFEDMSWNLNYFYFWVPEYAIKTHQSDALSTVDEFTQCSLAPGPPVVVILNLTEALSAIECAANRLRDVDVTVCASFTTFSNRSHAVPYFNYQSSQVPVPTQLSRKMSTPSDLHQVDPRVSFCFLVTCMIAALMKFARSQCSLKFSLSLV